MKSLRLMLAAMVMMAVGTANAQWKPSNTDYTRIDKPGATGQKLMKTLRTDDGKIIHAWVRWSEGLLYTDPEAGYFLHLQIFDKDGNALFGDEGKIVIDKPTATYTSDYGIALAPNGDILIAYPDARNDEERIWSEIFAYRFTQQGESVWDQDGVKVDAIITTAEKSDLSLSSVCVSGDNIFVSFARGDYNGENTDRDMQLTRLNATDGSRAWDTNLVVPDGIMQTMNPAPDGDVYIIYNNPVYGLEAQRINKDGQNVWGYPVTIEQDAVGDNTYVPTPKCYADGNGGLALAYRVLEEQTGFEVYNHLTPDGQVLKESVLANGNMEGDAGAGLLAVRDNQALVVWPYLTEYNENQMAINLFNMDGSYAWSKEGKVLEISNNMAFHPVKLIPQTDGWVLLYGLPIDWAAANFIACKINDKGEKVWSMLLGEEEFLSSGFSVVNDNQYAYIFFTRDNDVSEEGEEIPGTGGMYVMCIDIINASTGINEVNGQWSMANGQSPIYNLSGRKLNGKPTQKGIYIHQGRKIQMK